MALALIFAASFAFMAWVSNGAVAMDMGGIVYVGLAAAAMTAWLSIFLPKRG